MKMENIVVGCDGSETATEAVETAAQLSAWSGGTVHAVAASNPRDDAEMRRRLSSMPAEYQTAFSSGAHELEILANVARTLERRGVTCHTYQRSGDPADAILSVADQVDADLIVVGSRGLARGTRRFRGSVSTKVSAHADRSYLVILGD